MQPTAHASMSFPSLVKQWRQLRKFSQLDLALDAGVSQRHVSFLESGRSQPSRDMVLNLADAMELPLRDRNHLLNAAGFASIYTEKRLEDEDMAAVNKAVAMTLNHHMPFPAMAVDKHWNLIEGNEAAHRLVGLLGEPDKLWSEVDPSGKKNIYRLTFHPNGMRPLLANWALISSVMSSRLHNEMLADPMDSTLRQLFEDIRLLMGPESDQSHFVNSEPVPPVLPLELEAGGVCLKLISMVSSFGTATDVTAAELRIETFFPMDEVTEIFFNRLAQMP